MGTLGSLSVTGNITGGNILGGANVNATTHTGTTVSVTGTITGGNLNISGNAAAATPLSVTDTAPQGASKTVNIVNGTNGLAVVANITNGSYNSLQSTGDIALLATGTSIGNVGLSIIPWAAATSGIKMNTVSNVTTITLASTTVSIVGNVTAGTGNITGGNLLTGGLISSTGNITGGNLNTAGQVTATGNITGGNLQTARLISAAGNVSGGNLNVTGNIVDTGALTIITGASGNVSLAPNGTNVLVTTTTGANIAGTLNATGNANVGNLGATTVTATILTGTLSTAAQTNITSVGTLGSLSVSGNITGGNITTAGNLAIPTATANTNTTQAATTAFVVGQAGALTPVTIGTAAVGTSLKYAREDHTHSGVGSAVAGTGISVSAATGAVTFTNSGVTSVVAGTNIAVSAATGAVTVSVTGTVPTATTAATVTTAAQPNITSVGTLTSVSSSGNVTGGNLVTAGQLSATGNITGGNITVTNVTGTGSLNTAGNINFTNAEASDTAKIYANVSGAATSLVLEVSDDLASDRIVLRHRYFATANTVDMLSAQLSGNTEANVTVTGNLIATNQVTATGNITGSNLITAGVASATGNITTSNCFVGNGAFLTGISAAISVAKIENGNSNVWVQTPGGDVTVTAGGIANVAVFSTGSLTLSGAFGTQKNITANVVVAGNINAMLIGPVTFADGVGLTIPNSSTVYVYSVTG